MEKLEVYKIKIGVREYLATNGINAKEGDRVAYEWNPNDEINIALEVTNFILTTANGCGERGKFHKIISEL